MLSEKENYLKCLRGEVPEYVPQYTMGMSRTPGQAPSDVLMPPGFMFESRKKTGKDMWGVEYVESVAAEGRPFPTTRNSS